MERRAFLASAGATLLAVPRAAKATGGLDVEAQPALHTMRVLLASGGFPSPQTIDGWHFRWNDREYRGRAATVKLADGRMGLVDSVALDAYLYGVVSKEVSASWPPAAQQAQAILSRTFALRRLRPNREYDVVASEADQRYDGIPGETVEGRAAVDATAGEIVTFAGEPAHVAFSACCGGHTADAADAWHTAYPYLQGVVDPHCAGTPDFAWQGAVSAADLSRAWPALGGFGRLRAAELQDFDPSGRPRALAFIGERGSLSVATLEFRSKLGASVVRSTLVRRATLERDGSLTLEGNGRGHGVGLCQWGARMMAQGGAGPREIVQFYLPDTALGSG